MAVDYGQGGEGQGGENDGVVFWSRREKENREAKNPGEGESVEVGESTEVGETEGSGELDKRSLGKEVLGVLEINVYKNKNTTLGSETPSLWDDAA